MLACCRMGGNMDGLCAGTLKSLVRQGEKYSVRWCFHIEERLTPACKFECKTCMNLTRITDLSNWFLNKVSIIQHWVMYVGIRRGLGGKCYSFQHHGQSSERRHFKANQCFIMRVGWQFKAKIILYLDDLINCLAAYIPKSVFDIAVGRGSPSLLLFQLKTLFIIHASLRF